ncbi:MAG: phosphatase PAP2 family protein [Candidatus Caccovivens sp.]
MDFEIKIIEFLQAGRNVFFDRTFQIISGIGSVVGAVVLVLFFLLFKRKFAFWFLFSYGFVYLFVNLLKNWVERIRPFNVTDTIVNIGDVVTDYSFPSGHAACATAIAIFLGYFLFTKYKSKGMRVGIVLACSLYVGLVCLSRMYLGKHYLTDVLAGVALSAVFCGLGLTLMYFWEKKRKNYENKNGNKRP